MSGATRPCPGCGSPVDPGTKFCGQCGRDLRSASEAPKAGDSAAQAPPATQAEPAAPPAPASEPPKQAEAQVEPAAPPAKPAAGDKRTMLGMPAVKLQRPGPDAEKVEGAQPEPQPPAAQQPPAQQAATEQPAARKPQRTMLGMSAPVIQPPGSNPQMPADAGEPPAQAQPPAAQPPAQRGPAPNTNRTMLGMTAPTVDQARAQAEQLQQQAAQPQAAPQQPSQPQGAKPPHGAKHIPAASNRTMLGMNAVSAGGPGEAPGPARRSSAPPAPPAYGTRERASVRYGSDFDLSDSDRYRAPKRSRAGLFVGLALLALVILAGAAVGGYLLLSGGPDVRAAVAQGDDGEVLRVEVPGAPEGTKVRFAGTEQPLQGGVAAFALSADALHVGDNELTVDVIGPHGDVDQTTVTLQVRYRVRPDLTALQHQPPAVAIQVDALPGSQVTLDGEPLALDSDGHATKELQLPESDAGEDAYTREVPYHIRLPEGPPEDGVVRVRVPYAQMQIDRPGTDVVTDHDSVEMAGAVHPGATVTVDGQPVEVNDEGRFVYSYPLPEPRTYEPRLVARQAGRAPRATTLTIRRVEDMAAEAASFEPDEGMSYSRIQQNPSTYRGRKIAIEGRVYNVNVQGGRSDIQILARDCPRGQRCPLWVSYPAATDVTANDWVRVLGTVGGEQQFRSESNRVITVPRVDAQFVLPARE